MAVALVSSSTSAVEGKMARAHGRRTASLFHQPDLHEETATPKNAGGHERHDSPEFIDFIAAHGAVIVFNVTRVSSPSLAGSAPAT